MACFVAKHRCIYLEHLEHVDARFLDLCKSLSALCLAQSGHSNGTKQFTTMVCEQIYRYSRHQNMVARLVCELAHVSTTYRHTTARRSKKFTMVRGWNIWSWSPAFFITNRNNFNHISSTKGCGDGLMLLWTSAFDCTCSNLVQICVR